MWRVVKTDELILIVEEHTKVVHGNWENSLQMGSSEKHLGGWGWMGQTGKKSLKSKYWKT